eukprot:860224-Rhodomonas_salina.1
MAEVRLNLELQSCPPVSLLLCPFGEVNWLVLRSQAVGRLQQRRNLEQGGPRPPGELREHH